ncbi:MAG TPA: hypothetical protein VF798_06150 [Burkholderiaceae bacterium]
MAAGIINGARQGGSPAFDDQQQGQDDNADALAALNASLEVQKNAAVMAAAQGLKMGGQDGPGGGGAQTPAGDAAASTPAIGLPISLGAVPNAAVANASNPAPVADGPGSTAPAGADPSDVAMLAAAGVRPDDAAPNLPMSTRIQAMLEGTPLVEVDGQRPGAAGDAAAAPAAAMPQQTAQQAQQQTQALKSAQDSAIANPAFQKQGSTTHCSEGTYYIARALGANTAPLGSAAGQFYLANTQAANLAHAASTPGTGWRRIGLGDAQARANEGRLVVMVWSNPTGHGHTVTVRPDANNAQAATNPSVANIGPQNAVIPYHYAFDGSQRAQVKIYLYEPQ